MTHQSRKYRFRRIAVIFLSCLICCLWLGRISILQQVEFIPVATAQSADASLLVQQGINLYQTGNFQGAIAVWQSALNSYQNAKNSADAAIVRENLARASEQLGRSTVAIEYWEGAIAYYQQISDRLSVARLQTEQAQSYNNQGQPRKAIALLCGADVQGEQRGSTSDSRLTCDRNSALEIARANKDLTVEAAALGNLGNAYQSIGQYETAIAYLQSSLKIARTLNNLTYQAANLNSLGIAHVYFAKVNYRRANSATQQGDKAKAVEFKTIAQKYDTQALQYFQASLDLVGEDNLAKLRVLLNSIPLLYRTQASAADTAIEKATILLNSLSNSRHKVYGTIALANLLSSSTNRLTGFDFQCSQQKQPQAEKLIQTAIANARQLQDNRAISFALGQLGHTYECRKNYQQALNFTRQAQWAAQQDLNSKDSLYLWQWQAGRIFEQQDREAKAIEAYQQAVATLENIRGDILTSERDLQFDFRDTVEPIYRQLTTLRLRRTVLSSLTSKQRTEQLNSALKTINSLQLAELQNYFGNDCVLTLPSEVTNFARLETAIFSSIILDKRTAILVSLPNGEKRLAWIDRDRQNLKNATNEFRRGLERYRDLTYNPRQAQQFYDWIIRPFAPDLEVNNVKTLVFEHDGILRSIPMAALHDGKQFLIEKYAIATTPSLTLTNPKPLDRERLRVLALGLTQAASIDGRTFPALTHVAREIKAIAAQIPGSKQLLNENFTGERLQQELSQTTYPIIHIATHGEFGSEPEDTFLLAGDNTKLTITALDTTLRSTLRSSDVDLIALTACQTAVGDERAALGLAGVAVRAGVGSALASLWFIQDASTVSLVNQFYERLSDSGASKAKALQAAQQAAIASKGQYAHPAYWAAFILIGNWL
jgi:CHAT domain-containing protein